MRLLLAALVATALLLTPMASAANTSLGVSAPTDPKLSTLTAAPVTDPVTIQLHLNSYTCTADSTATVKLSANVTGNFTVTLEKTSVAFAVPGSASIGGIPSGPQAYNQNKDVNFTVNATGPGNGTIEVVATFDGKIDGCSAQPDLVGGDTSTDFTSAYKSVNITLASVLQPSTPTPTTTTSPTPTTGTPTSTTVASSTPVSSSPVSTSTPEQPTPTTEEGKKSFLPGPTVPLVAAAVVGVAVLLRRK